MNSIVMELRNNNEYAKNYLYHIHHCLSISTTYINTGNYAVCFQALYQDFYFKELINREWGNDLITNETAKLLRIYHNMWFEYVQNVPYANDFFVFYDPNWHNLVRLYLIPALESMERDIDTSKIIYHNIDGKDSKIESYKAIYNPEARPSDEDIIWKVKIIYQLMIENKLIEKPFMGVEISN